MVAPSLYLVCLSVFEFVLHNYLLDIRLPVNSGGDRASQGVVSVMYNAVWGQICADWFDDVDAHIICRELNFPSKLGKSSYTSHIISVFRNHSNFHIINKAHYSQLNMLCSAL